MSNLKIISANFALAANSFVQWVGDVDTVLKLLGTLIALPVAYYSAKSFYWQARIKKAEALNLEKTTTSIDDSSSKGN